MELFYSLQACQMRVCFMGEEKHNPQQVTVEGTILCLSHTNSYSE